MQDVKLERGHLIDIDLAQYCEQIFEDYLGSFTAHLLHLKHRWLLLLAVLWLTLDRVNRSNPDSSVLYHRP
jgi:hypothetical protein